MRAFQISRSLLRCNSLSGVRTFSAAATPVRVAVNPDGWDAARPYQEIPGPSRLEFVRLFMPGGPLSGADAVGIQRYLRDRYGSLARLPGMLGKRDSVFTFDARHFETVFRTEGQYPLRRNLDTYTYYRHNVCPATFKDMGGLVSDGGASWLRLRQAANPVMLSPSTTLAYIPSVDQVSREFVQRIGALRNGEGEMPADFMNELSLWAMESIGLIALDRRLGVWKADPSGEADQLIGAVRSFFRLGFELEVKPSIWRYYKTRQFRELMTVFDVMSKYITRYIDEAILEIARKKPDQLDATNGSVLQKMLAIDPHYAFLITFDMIFAGIDTTSSVMATLLHRLAVNPEKQEKLREEIFRLLPDKESAITAENFQEFEYFRACLKESMRLQPQVPVNFRATGKNIVLDGYRIPKGIDMVMAHNLLQTSDEHFAKSKQFLPERWIRRSSEYESNRNPFVFQPFGFGARKCIGKRFGEMELQLLTARILREYRVEWHHGDIEYVNSLIITPKSPLKFKMVPL